MPHAFSFARFLSSRQSRALRAPLFALFALFHFSPGAALAAEAHAHAPAVEAGEAAAASAATPPEAMPRLMPGPGMGECPTRARMSAGQEPVTALAEAGAQPPCPRAGKVGMQPRCEACMHGGRHGPQARCEKCGHCGPRGQSAHAGYGGCGQAHAACMKAGRHADAGLQARIEALEKRLDLMQTLLQRLTRE